MEYHSAMEVSKGKITMLAPSKFKWRIENFSKLNVQKHFSDEFMICCHKWRVLIFPTGNNTNHLSIYLKAVKSTNWPNATFSLSVVNQIQGMYTVTKDTMHQFTEEEDDWGFTTFMLLGELYHPRKGFLVNDTCIIEAEISVCGIMENSTCNSGKNISGMPAEAESAVEEPTEVVAPVVSGMSAEVESAVEKPTQVVAPVEVVAPVAKTDSVAESVLEPETQTDLDEQVNEPELVAETDVEVQAEEQVPESWTLVECEAPTTDDDVTVSMPTTQTGETMPLPEYPGAGQIFEDGKHREGVLDNKFVDIGGFSILKSQALLYKQIWLKYGHIASSEVLIDSYSGQVMLVTDIMTAIKDMHCTQLSKVTSEMIDSWGKKIKMAEKLEFNIRWLREKFEDVIQDFNQEQEIKAELLDHDQSLMDAKARMAAAEEALISAKDELKKAQENVSDLETRLNQRLSERKEYFGNGNDSVLKGVV